MPPEPFQDATWASCFRETNGALHAAIASHCTRASPDALRVVALDAAGSAEADDASVSLAFVIPTLGERVKSPLAFALSLVG